MVYNLTSGTSALQRCSLRRQIWLSAAVGSPVDQSCHRQNDAFELCDEIGLETLDVPTKRRVREAPQADGGVGGVS
jgi:hypothetical protein